MNSECVLSHNELPIFDVLHQTMAASVSDSTYASETLTYALTRTFSIIRTVKSISEIIIEKGRTTIIKYIQKLSDVDDFLFNQLKGPAFWMVEKVSRE